MNKNDELYCEHYQRAAELIGGRWTATIIRVLLGGVHHFNAIRSEIPGLSDRMLSERLRELDHEGVVSRVVFPEMPVRVEYHLTDKGRALAPVMDALIAWIGEWAAPDPAPLARKE
ncbi:MAG: helix-turn-helix domain-containing protein [Alkalispirochaeta sp.]|jgi:DNA-binding HxlR family transcriptional regulator